MTSREVTRDEAAATVEALLAQSGHQFSGRTVLTILALDELQLRRPCVYNLAVPLEECWIAYLELERLDQIRESDIVLVSRRDGTIVYAGGASDEG